VMILIIISKFNNAEGNIINGRVWMACPVEEPKPVGVELAERFACT